MSETVRGVVINLNAFGAAVRLESGELASAPAGDIESHRRQYESAFAHRKHVHFVRHPGGRHPMVTLAPQIDEPELDEQLAEFFKSTESWESDADGVSAHERHFLHKKKRAALFAPKQNDER
ncbi:MAG: hypothetical protein KGN02_03370 [bacterium]|nr:hypothetical protein [bacterium]